MSQNTRRAALICWLLLAANLLLAMAVAGWQMSADQLWLLFSLAGYLLLSMALLPFALAVIYRASFAHWWAWALLLALWIAGGTVTRISTLPAWVGLAGNLIFLGSWVALLAGLGVLLFQRDLALPLIGLLSLIVVWSAAIAWMIRGDLIAEMMGLMLGAPGAGGSLFWIVVFFNTLLCILPIAAVSFLVHTIAAVNRELRGDTRPIAPIAKEEP